MTQEQIIEGNKLIAGFMDVPFDDEDFINDRSISNSNACTVRYHRDWNWLMPVVQKIQDIDITPTPNYTGYRIEIVVQGYVKINGFPMPPIFTNVCNEGSLINALWKAVTQFIQFYNQTQKP